MMRTSIEDLGIIRSLLTGMLPSKSKTWRFWVAHWVVGLMQNLTIGQIPMLHG